MTAPDTAQAAARQLGNTAETQVHAGRVEDAITSLRRALTLDPGYHAAHRRIWHLYGDLGRLQQAIDAFRAALLVCFRGAPPPHLKSTRQRIEHTTLCAIDCVNPELTIPALQRSLAGCEFDAVKLLTHLPVSAPGIDVVPIAPLDSIAAYSTFVIKQLIHHIDTDHVLLIQWDGFVCDPAAWAHTFLLYDYIGARWPLGLNGVTPECAVGNGGFSLRSRSLLAALQDETINAENPEDAVICIRHRPYLEQRHDIAFADAATADRFSSEHCALETPTFGFHGIINVSRHLPWPELQRFDFFG